MSNGNGLATSEAFRQQLILLLLFGGIAVLACLADRAPLDRGVTDPEMVISAKFIYYWQGVVYRFFPGPYVYRVLIPYAYAAMNDASHVSLLTIDFYTKILILTGCQYAFFAYLSRFFERLPAISGVLIFDSLLGYLLAYIRGPSITESIDLLNFLILTLGLIAIHGLQFRRLGVILFIGLLNRETPLILVPIALLYEWLMERQLRGALLATAIAALAFLATRTMIPSLAGINWFNLNELRNNLGSAAANLRLAALLGPLILLGAHRFRDHPRFLRIAAAALPALVVIHYFVAQIVEARLWIPVFPFLIPLVVNNLAKLGGLSPAARTP